MCLIADANKLGEFLKEPPTGDTEPIHKWLKPGTGRRGGVIVYSIAGKFRTEVSRAARERLDVLSRAGRAKLFDESDLAAGMELIAEGHMASDDPHVLALAAVSRARVVYTADRDLMTDFRSRKVMGELRGKIYSGQQNRNLLRPDMCDHLCE